MVDINIVRENHEIITPISEGGVEEMKFIERIGRVCYGSEDKINLDSYKVFLGNLIKRGHESVIEHMYITVKFVTSIAIARELIRHRLCNFTEASTRYWNLAERGFTYILPSAMAPSSDEYVAWFDGVRAASFEYVNLIEKGFKPEEARSVLPLSHATTIFVTANYREWRHILKLRCAPGAHPDMRNLMIPLLKEFKEKLPIIFGDITISG